MDGAREATSERATPEQEDETAAGFLTLHEIVRAAAAKLDPKVYGYLIGGTETETSVRRNRQALDSVALRPRVLRDVRLVDPSTRLFGRDFHLPVILAPVGSLESFHPEGASAAYRGATAGGAGIMVSSVTRPGLEETAHAADGPKIFQLYVRGGDDFIDDYVNRAVDADYDAFAITVDSHVYSRRERDIAQRFIKYWRAQAEGMAYQAAFSWDGVKRFKDTHTMPLILKGIGTAEDAAIACEHGVEVIYVSNHGGRQLDHGLGSFAVLPEIVREVRGRATIIVDGGFCRGTDIVKAIAAGADAVAIGRLYCYGLAAAGAAGVARVLALLEEEVRETLALLGVTRLSDLGPSYLAPAHPVNAPHVHSAFPLLQTPWDGVYSPGEFQP